MRKYGWMVAVFLAMSCMAMGQGIGAGRQPIDVWASVYGSNTSYTLSNVFEQVAGREMAIGIDRGAWLVDENLTVPSNVTLFVKRGSYFLLTNSATMTILGEVAAGDHLVFMKAPEGGECMVDGTNGTFTFATSNWFGGGIDWAGRARLLDLEALAGLYLWTSNSLALLDQNFSNLNDDFQIVNQNFSSVSGDFHSVAGTVNDHAGLIRSNAVAHNLNWWYVLPNLFDQLFDGVDGWDRAAFTNSLWAANTNAGTLSPSGLGNYFSLTNWYFNRFSEIVMPWTHGVVDPVSNAVASLMFDGAYVSHWGYASNGTRTVYTNVYPASAGYADYAFVFMTNTVGSYAALSGPFSWKKAGQNIEGITISAKGRYSIFVRLILSDITPAYSSTNSASEGTFYYTIRHFNTSDSVMSRWTSIGRLIRPSDQAWIPTLDVSGWGPPGAYESSIFYTDTFLITDSDLSAAGGAVTIKVMAGYYPDSATVDSRHMVRSAGMTILRTASW